MRSRAPSKARRRAAARTPPRSPTCAPAARPALHVASSRAVCSALVVGKTATHHLRSSHAAMPLRVRLHGLR